MIFYEAAEKTANCGVIVGDQNAYCHRGVLDAALLDRLQAYTAQVTF
jgi:hypothetical protein